MTYISKNKTTLSGYCISFLSIAMLSISVLETKCPDDKKELITINSNSNSTNSAITLMCSDIQPAKIALSAINIIMGVLIAILDRSNLKKILGLEINNEKLSNENGELRETMTQRGMSLNNFAFPVNTEPFGVTTPESSADTVYPPNPILR